MLRMWPVSDLSLRAFKWWFVEEILINGREATLRSLTAHPLLALSGHP
jgi:hypothetical protein